MEQKGWLPVMEMGGSANEDLVREFYENLKLTNRAAKSVVRGIEVIITPANICARLGIPAVRVADCDLQFSKFKVGTGWPSLSEVSRAMCVTEIPFPPVKYKELRDDYKALLYLICYNLMPMRNTSEFIEKRMFLAYAIIRGKNIDFGDVIFSEISLAWQTKKGTDVLPFPVLITGYCLDAGVVVRDKDKVVDSETPLGLSFWELLEKRAAHPPPPPVPRKRGRVDEVSTSAAAAGTSSGVESDSDQMVSKAYVDSLFERMEAHVAKVIEKAFAGLRRCACGGVTRAQDPDVAP